MKKTDDELVMLERDLKGTLSSLRLPAAPIGLQRRVESMSAGGRTNASPRTARRRNEWTSGAPTRRIAATAAMAAIVIAVAAVGVPLALSPHAGMAQASNAGESGLVTSPKASISTSSLPTRTPQALFSAADGSRILADGPSVAWQKVAMTKFGQQDSVVMGVAKLGAKVVMAVNVMTGTPATGEGSAPTFFETTDGSSWARIPVSGDPFANIGLQAVIGTSNGLLAIGQGGIPDNTKCSSDSNSPDNPAWCRGNGYVPWVVLTSSDGRTWQRLPGDPFVPHIEAMIEASGTGISVSGPKGTLVWGYTTSGPSAGTPAVFRSFHSTDMVNWSSSTIPGISAKWEAAPGGGTWMGFPWPLVEATADGFVAVSVNPTSPGAWFSPDGVHWTATTSAPDKVSVYAFATSAAAGHDGIAASLLKKWYRASAEGANWQAVGVGPQLPSTGWLAGDGDRVVIVSGREVDWSADGITWHRGKSTADLPEDSGVSTGPDNSWVVGPSVECWLVGSLIVAFTADRSTLYVGHVGG
jgi:hypothetical protein